MRCRACRRICPRGPRGSRRCPRALSGSNNFYPSPVCFKLTHAGSTRTRTLRNPTSARISVPALLRDTGDASPRPWTWRTDLGATQPFWEGWFVGLSKKFLEARGGKLLILAGTDRLDKELMIGQMQGKYQLLVLPEVGHFVHEDAPEKTAVAVSCVLEAGRRWWGEDANVRVGSLWSFIKGMIARRWCCRRSLRRRRSRAALGRRNVGVHGKGAAQIIEHIKHHPCVRSLLSRESTNSHPGF